MNRWNVKKLIKINNNMRKKRNKIYKYDKTTIDKMYYKVYSCIIKKKASRLYGWSSRKERIRLMEDRNMERVLCANYGYQLFPFEYFLNSMNKLEVKNIELWGAGPHLYQDDCTYEDIRTLRKKITDHHLTVKCYTPEQCMYPINIASSEEKIRSRSMSYMKKALEIANIMEAPMTLVTVGQGYRNQDKEEAFKRCVDSLLELEEKAESCNTTIVLEHLTVTTTNLCVTAKELARMMKIVKGPSMKAMVDVDMAARVGEGAKEYLDEMGDAIYHCHFIDGMPGGHLALGDGILPMDTYLKDLMDYGYEGYFTMEVLSDRYQLNPEAAYEQGLGWFRARGFK